MIALPPPPDESAGAPAPAETGARPDRQTWAFRQAALAVAGVCVVAGVLCFAVDVPVASWAAARPLPRELKRLLDLSEIFAHTTGVVALLAALALLDPAWAWAWDTPRVCRRANGTASAHAPFPRMIAAAFAGGIMADLVKLMVTRVRPRALDLAAASSAAETFDRAVASVPDPGHGDLASFPSGHAAVAAGFATMLAWRYPHGTGVFATFAALAAAQRVFASAHYPSDVCFGSALGVAGAAMLLAMQPTPPRDGA
jgi:membrane-associated phospholipid phosphatase